MFFTFFEILKKNQQRNYSIFISNKCIRKKIFLMTNNMSLKIICNEKREFPIPSKRWLL